MQTNDYYDRIGIMIWHHIILYKGLILIKTT